MEAALHTKSISTKSLHSIFKSTWCSQVQQYKSNAWEFIRTGFYSNGLSAINTVQTWISTVSVMYVIHNNNDVDVDLELHEICV